jgi:hypothetical protein
MTQCAFNKGSKCSALVRMDCVGCTFCKSADELAESRHKVTARLNTLPPNMQVRIKEKYYPNGNRFKTGSSDRRQNRGGTP